MNNSGFIEFGFKNSITIAYIPLFLAIYIGQGIIQKQHPAVSNAWWIVGGLTALAVLFRETFVPFAALGLVTVYIAGGKNAALRFFLGGITTGTLVIGSILTARGSATGIIEAYQDLSLLFGAIPKEEIQDNFFYYGCQTILLSYTAFGFSVLAIIVLSSIIRRSRQIFLSSLFWLSFIVLTFIEPATKIGYSYHFAVALPGFAGLCALCLREIAKEWPNLSWASNGKRDAIALPGIALSVIWLSFNLSSMNDDWRLITQETLIDGDWSALIRDSHTYPFLAAEIEKIIPKNGTLSLNRNLEILYLLTDHLPPSSRLSNLTTLGFHVGFSVPRIKEDLMACAPDVIFMDPHENWLFGYNNFRLFAAIEETRIYEPALEIQFIDENYRFVIFRKTKETVCLTP
ncbi:hypothetical protein FACS1894116_09130 [Betaproteobacteria bacterium]|nr:hypothetical protein FACS1894116_09130 [Betaproteobacteria bacterium]GHT99657.1 hypothetical protein FACS1894154_07160 [Betaproteobacteria bacterium]GHU24368.1 hypothetical protein FACS189488_08850 [Betaproteobacteria bacterium]